MPKNNELSSETRQKRKKTMEDKPVAEMQSTSHVNSPTSDSKKTSKNNIDSWVSVANLFLTLILGIYLAYRNENLQQNIINWQKQAEIAEIAISASNISDNTISIDIVNNGPSSAKNIRLSICLSYIPSIWEDVAKDINSFDIRTKNQSLKMQVEILNSKCGYINGDDEIVFELASIPPNETVSFSISPKSIVETKYVELRNQVFVTSSQSLGDRILSETGVATVIVDPKDLFYQYLQKFSTAFFITSISCENCAIENDILDLNLWSISEWSLSAGTLSFGSQNMQYEQELYRKLIVPKNLDITTIESPYYLIDLSYGKPILINVSEEEYKKHIP